MDLREQLRRHRKDNRLIVGGLVVLLVVFTGGFYLLQRSRDLPPLLATNKVLLFVLWYINVVLILVIVFVLARNLFKLLVERHHRILGSKFKTKLVLTYFGLSLIPVLLLFLISTQLLRGSLDRWFSTPLEEVLPLAGDVAQELPRTLETLNLASARRVLGEMEGIDVGDLSARPALQQRLRELREMLDLDYLAVYRGTDLVHAVIHSGSSIADLPEPGRAFLQEAAELGEARGQPPSDTAGTLILGAASRQAGGEEAQAAPGADPGAGSAEAGSGDPSRAVVVVAGRLLDAEAAAQARELIEVAQGHRQLVVQEDDFRASYLLIFLMLTLLILLISSWVGLYLARRITVPIQALAEGTRRISDGELSHRVEVAADDELGVLVSSFNRMTGELESSRLQLEHSYRELATSNERLAEERALIAAVLENVAAGVISVDAGGAIFTCNGAALEMLRQSEDEVLGRPADEAWADAERGKLVSLLEESRDQRRLTRDVHMILEGEWKTFEVKVTHIGGGRHGKRGDASPPPETPSPEAPAPDLISLERGVRVLVLEDLTELIKAQQLAAWREAARRIAHEIKNPLTPIKLAAERLLSKHHKGAPDLGKTLEEGVDIIVREVRTLQGMVDEFSRYARMPRPQPARVNLKRLLEETVQLYRDVKPGVKVEARLDEATREAWIDAEQLRRALINLLDNAVEATDAPGEVSVTAGRAGGYLRIDVADTGRGIPDDARDKLFLPYFSTKGRGTGLGLAIVHRIVTDHHGRITTEANSPRGTVFTIELPTDA